MKAMPFRNTDSPCSGMNLVKNKCLRREVLVTANAGVGRYSDAMMLHGYRAAHDVDNATCLPKRMVTQWRENNSRSNGTVHVQQLDKKSLRTLRGARLHGMYIMDLRCDETLLLIRMASQFKEILAPLWLWRFTPLRA